MLATLNSATQGNIALLNFGGSEMIGTKEIRYVKDNTVPRIGFFTRLLDEGTAAQRYGWALEQILQAERAGFATAWIAQHHFNANEGGLPSPWPFLGAAAQATARIRLGTAVVTLPHENAVRTAEDAAVVDVRSEEHT